MAEAMRATLECCHYRLLAEGTVAVGGAVRCDVCPPRASQHGQPVVRRIVDLQRCIGVQFTEAMTKRPVRASGVPDA